MICQEWGLNPRSSHYMCDALTTELSSQMTFKSPSTRPGCRQVEVVGSTERFVETARLTGMVIEKCRVKLSLKCEDRGFNPHSWQIIFKSIFLHCVRLWCPLNVGSPFQTQLNPTFLYHHSRESGRLHKPLCTTYFNLMAPRPCARGLESDLTG